MNMTNGSSEGLCSAPVQYTISDGKCQKELAQLLKSANCTNDSEAYVLVERNAEQSAQELISLLEFIARPKCLEKAVPFLCLILFGLCSESGVPIQPNLGQCEVIRDEVCTDEAIIIEASGNELPDCATFSSEISSCGVLNVSLPTNGTNVLGTVRKHFLLIDLFRDM